MTDRPATSRNAQHTGTRTRHAALVAAVGLLAMAILAPLAQFGVLATLIVPADPAATTLHIAASMGLFAAAIAAFGVVAALDVAVAWGVYVLLRPASARAALVVALLRVAYAAGFAFALLHLVDAARLVSGASATGLVGGELQAEVASAIGAFHASWDLALVVFGLHLLGLGGLLSRSADFPRFLAVLVVAAGAGYMVDSLGRILVPGYGLTLSTVTFIGEALLIVWLFRVAIRSGQPVRISDGWEGRRARRAA
jgi:hypothetical protein